MNPRARGRWYSQGVGASLLLPKVPPLQTGPMGGSWRVDYNPHIESKCFWGVSPPQLGHFLLSNGNPVYPDNHFSDTTYRTLQTMGIALKHAHGVVILFNPGLGTMVYNLCLKPSVRRVLVFEENEIVAHILRNNGACWPGFNDKVEVYHGYYNYLSRTWLSHSCGLQELPDFLYVQDYRCGASYDGTMDQAQYMAELTGARTVSWFKQEFSFMRWVTSWGLIGNMRGRRTKRDLFDRWCLEVGMVVPECTPEYVDLCRQAWDNRQGDTNANIPHRPTLYEFGWGSHQGRCAGEGRQRRSCDPDTQRQHGGIFF